MYVVLLEPRPIWRTKNAKRPQEIPPVKYVVDNASEVKPANAQRNIQRLLKQDLNMVLTMLRNAKALLGTSVSSEQHTDGTNQLTRYDFLTVLYGDLRSTWNHHRGVSRRSQQTVIPSKKKRKQNNIIPQSGISRELLLLDAMWLKLIRKKSIFTPLKHNHTHTISLITILKLQCSHNMGT